MICILMCCIISNATVLDYINDDRLAMHLPKLVENRRLDKAAQNKSNLMYKQKFFAHTAPDGRTPWDFISASGYSYESAGENLAINYSDPNDEEVAWMMSPGHRENILNPKFKDIGIGIKGQYTSVEFGEPMFK